MIPSLARSLSRWRPGRLVQQTARATGWQILRVLLQSASLFMLARAAGAGGYGALAGTTALYVLVAQLAGLGTGVVLARDIARGADAAKRWRSSFVIHLGSGLILLILAWPATIWLLQGRISPLVSALIGIAELIVAPAIVPSSYWLLATDRVGASSGLQTVPTAARCCASAILLAAGTASLPLYGISYCGTMALLVAVTVYVFRPRSAQSRQDWPTAIQTVRQGLSYMASSVAVTAGSELDKALLLKFAGPLQTGEYAAAFRVAQATTIPVNAFVLAFVPRLFRGHRNSDFLLQVSRYLGAALAYGTVAGLLLWLAAPYLHVLLGDSFRASTTMLYALSLYVLSNSFRQVTTAALTTSDHQRFRNLVEGGGGLLFACCTFVAVRGLGWVGAAGVSICADFTIGGVAYYYLRRRRQNGTVPPRA